MKQSRDDQIGGPVILEAVDAEKNKPTARPGQLTTSGSSRTRTSVTVKITIRQVKNSHFTVTCVRPKSR